MAKEILMNVITNNEYAFQDPAPQIVVTELGDSSVNLSVRATTSIENFWTMNEELIIGCKKALDNAGIEIPFPQRDVHLFQKTKRRKAALIFRNAAFLLFCKDSKNYFFKSSRLF